MNGKIWSYGLILLLSLFAIVMPVSAQPTADSFGVNDAYGAPGTYVIVPVHITNASNGPIQSIVFNIAYDKNVINVTNVLKGNLTSDWNVLGFNNNFAWGTRIFLAGPFASAIPNGSSGSVVLLNFSVIGNPGETSDMNLNDIELSDPDGNVDLDTVPTKNGTFYVPGMPPVPVPEYNIFGLLALIGLLVLAISISIRKKG